MLLECEGDALDLSGDMGAVGRFSVCQGQAKDDEELLLDLKGKMACNHSYLVFECTAALKFGEYDRKLEDISPLSGCS